ncbi:MAG: aldehyde dehydrogenase (NADP(+)) [Terriglobia bacterium]
MELHGKNLLGSQVSAMGNSTISAYDPRQGKTLSPPFFEATREEIHGALELAEQAFHTFRLRSPEESARFLEAIAKELKGLKDALSERAVQETGLTMDRLDAEFIRTQNQIRLFTSLVREGSWVDARIDHGDAERKPVRKPDVRRMLIPIGPVVVFGASNFPFAFSVAGGDTISALAAGNPVVVKSHPAHPGTSELAARAIVKAVKVCGLAEGVFSMLHGSDPEVGLALVRHPLTKAVAFTGSQRAGRALFDAATHRPDPIPVYAEMGSVNPIFVLPGALRERSETLAQGVIRSVTLGVGQFCTCPGLLVGVESDDLMRLTGRLKELFKQAPSGPMFYPQLLQSYQHSIDSLRSIPGVQLTSSNAVADPTKTEALPTLVETDVTTFAGHGTLRQEVFGPSTVIVKCGSREAMMQVARLLEGSLTATLHGTENDLIEHRELTSLLETKVGRLIFNGYPTGVEVCPAMHHGGPFPATLDPKFTSVGTAAIQRFVRPICYQDFPQEALPAELQDANNRKIWQMVDGQLTKT